MKPLVSIIVPSFNRAHCIKETLQSVLDQTYDAWECIVVDDGSTDTTIEVVTSLAKRDSRIRLYKRPKSIEKGANSCRNHGFRKSTGHYIQWLDSDDLLSPSKIEKQVNCLLGTTGTLATCNWGYYKESVKNVLHENLDVYRDYKNTKQFLTALTQKFGFLPIHAYLIPRELLVKHSISWNEALVTNQDGDFISQVLSVHPSIVFAPEAHVWYRVESTNSVSSISKKEKAKALIQSWKEIENRIVSISPDYMSFMKKKLYDRLVGQFPILVEAERDFFKNKRTKNVSWIEKIKSIIK